MISSWRLFKNSIPFTISLPLPPPFLCWLPLSLPFSILCTLPVPHDVFTTLHILLALVIIIVIAINWMLPLTAWCSGIRLVLPIIIVVVYHILLQWSNNQKIAWLELPAAWWLNLWPEITTTLPTEMLTAVFNHPCTGCLPIGAIDLIPECMEVVPPPIGHLVVGIVKLLPPFMRRWLPTTPDKANTCSCGAATLALIVKCGELWLDQDRIYHKRRPMLSLPWSRKYCISLWAHGCVLRWIPF